MMTSLTSVQTKGIKRSIAETNSVTLFDEPGENKQENGAAGGKKRQRWKEKEEKDCRFFFLRLRGGISEARSTGAPLRACRKKSAQPPSNPRNFENFQAKTLRQRNAQARHNSPWGTPPDSRPLTSYSTSKPGLRSRSLPPFSPPLSIYFYTHTHTHTH